MKRLIPLFVGVALLSLAPVGHAAPKKKKKPPTTQPDKGKQQPAPKPQPQPQSKTPHTTPGVILSMSINKAGEITEIGLRISGSQNNEWIKGCGAKSAEHPLLNEAFLAGRLIYVDVDASDCFKSVLVPKP